MFCYRLYLKKNINKNKTDSGPDTCNFFKF